MSKLAEPLMDAAKRVVRILMECGVPAAVFEELTGEYVAFHVEDMPTISKVTIATLNKYGYQVNFAQEGTELTEEQIVRMAEAILDARDQECKGDSFKLPQTISAQDSQLNKDE